MNVQSMESGMPTDKARLLIYMDHEVKAGLEKLAEAHNRSMSNFVETLIMKAIEDAKHDGTIK